MRTAASRRPTAVISTRPAWSLGRWPTSTPPGGDGPTNCRPRSCRSVHRASSTTWSTRSPGRGRPAGGWPADRLPAQVLAVGDRWATVGPNLTRRLGTSPRTLCHGDFRLDNLRFANDGEVDRLRLAAAHPGQRRHRSRLLRQPIGAHRPAPRPGPGAARRVPAPGSPTTASTTTPTTRGRCTARRCWR